MEKEVLVALIGAVSTIGTALIGAYQSIRAKQKSATTKNKSTVTYRSEATIIATAFVVAAGIIAYGYFITNKKLVTEKKQIINNDIGVTDSLSFFLAPYKAAIRKASGYPVDYVVLSCIINIDIEKVMNASEKLPHLEAIWTINYTIQALKDITPTYNSFYELYYGTSDLDIQYSPGSNDETILQNTTAAKKWQVLLNLKKGEKYSIVTSCKQIYLTSYKNKPEAESHFFNFLRNNEEIFLYENDKDVIDDFMLRIESASLDLKLDNNTNRFAGIEKKTGEINWNIETKTLSNKRDTPKRAVVVARFHELYPNENAAFKVTFGNYSFR